MSALLSGITLKNKFTALTAFIHLEHKLKLYKNICKNHDYCYKEKREKHIISKYILGEKSLKPPFVIYVNTESLLENIDACYKDTEKTSTTKVNKHTASGYSLFTNCSFDSNKNNHDY